MLEELQGKLAKVNEKFDYLEQQAKRLTFTEDPTCEQISNFKIRSNCLLTMENSLDKFVGPRFQSWRKQNDSIQQASLVIFHQLCGMTLRMSPRRFRMNSDIAFTLSEMLCNFGEKCLKDLFHLQVKSSFQKAGESLQKFITDVEGFSHLI